MPDLCVSHSESLLQELYVILIKCKQVHYIAAEEEYLPLREKSVDGMPCSGFANANECMSGCLNCHLTGLHMLNYTQPLVLLRCRGVVVMVSRYLDATTSS